MSLKNGSAAVFGNSYGYSSATGRLTSVGDGTYTAHYTWQDGTGLMAQNQIKRDSDSSVITTHNRTYGSRLSNYNLLSVSNTTGAATRAYSYVYNTKDQRTRMTLPDGAYWEYAYDDKGQVVSGVKKDAAGNVIPGQSYGYNYDGIGNRNTTKHGMFGNQDTDAITQTYTSNSVNQYTQITTPGIAPVVGEADTDTKVKVIRNDSNAAASGEQVITTDRDGVYFMGMFKNVDNSNSAQTIPYTVYAIKTDYNNNKQFIQKASSSYTVPKTPQILSYDDDGNQLTRYYKGQLWNLTWNGENRMISTILPDGKKLEYAYDFTGRRIYKKVYDWVNDAWTLTSHLKFTYNGYKLIAEYDGTNETLLLSYTWQPNSVGQDVPLSMTVASSSTTYFYIVDGNKNVRAMVDSSGNVVAEYTYNPFGKITSQTGTLADINPFRFSSEYYDKETGLIYYNYRYYDANLGRWLNRDPIQEDGGLGLYRFVNNNSISNTDRLGLLFDILLDWRDRTKDTPILGPVNNIFYGGIWAIVNPHHVAGGLWDRKSEISERAKAGALAAQNFMTLGLDKYWFDLFGHPSYNSNFNNAYSEAQNAISAFLTLSITRSITKLLTPKCIKVVPVKTLSRRDYLNRKFNRTGNLHADINARSGFYPPGQGFESGTRQLIEFPKGMNIDRYGGFFQNGKFIDLGNYASPAGTPFHMRSLQLVKQKSPYSVYKILKPFKAEGGKVAPWFGQPGGGTQYLLPDTVENMVKQGYLKLIKRN